VSLDPRGPSYSWCWAICCGLYCDPGYFRTPGRWAPSGCGRSECRANALGLLWIQVQTGRNPCHRTGRGFLCPWIPGVSVTPGVGEDIVASSPLILGVSEHLGVRLPLGVVGVGVEPAPKVCSGHRFRPESFKDSVCSCELNCTLFKTHTSAIQVLPAGLSWTHFHRKIKFISNHCLVF